MISTGGTTTLGLYDFKSALDDFGRIDYWVSKPSGYALNKRVLLANGDEVKSTVNNNTINPNTTMTGWVFNSPLLVYTNKVDLPVGYEGQKAYISSTESDYVYLSGVWKALSKYSVNLKDFPRINAEVDDTGRFSRAISSLTTSSIQTITGLSVYAQQELVVPAGIYEISDIISPSQQMVVRSEGQSIIRQNNATKNIFNYINGFLARVSGIKFMGGKHHIYFENPNYDATVLLFNECEFWDSNDYAIKTLGTGGVDNHLSAYALANNCKFSGCKKVLDNVCDKFEFRGGWVYLFKNNFDANTAAIKNTKGEIVFDKVMGVPKLGSQASDTNFRANVRWFDNYGVIRAVNARFGGEDEGIPIVYNYVQETLNTNGAVVSLKDCQISSGHMTYRTDAGAVRLMTAVPQLISIKDCNHLINAPYVSVDPSLNLDTYFATIPDAASKFKVRIDGNMTGGIGLTIPTQLVPFASGDIIVSKKGANLVSKTSLDATKVKLVFELPASTDKQSFILTLSGCQNEAGSPRYRDFSSFVFSTVVGNMTGVGVIKDIVYSAMPKPVSVNITSPTTKVIISSVYWGNGASGDTYQLDTSTNKTFTIIVDNVSGSTTLTKADILLLQSN